MSSNLWNSYQQSNAIASFIPTTNVVTQTTDYHTITNTGVPMGNVTQPYWTGNDNTWVGVSSGEFTGVLNPILDLNQLIASGVVEIGKDGTLRMKSAFPAPKEETEPATKIPFLYVDQDELYFEIERFD